MKRKQEVFVAPPAPDDPNFLGVENVSDHCNVQWREIPGWEGYYEVSNVGDVRSKERMVRREGARASLCRIRSRLMSANLVHGHLHITLRRFRFRKCYYVHQLVMMAFVGPCPEGMECCHEDGDKTNNTLGNLRYDTRRSNAKDKLYHGVVRKLCREDVLAIREEYARGGVTQRQLGARYGVRQSTIKCIIHRTIWKFREDESCRP
jgi:hypothetical protein